MYQFGTGDDLNVRVWRVSVWHRLASTWSPLRNVFQTVYWECVYILILCSSCSIVAFILLFGVLSAVNPCDRTRSSVIRSCKVYESWVHVLSKLLSYYGRALCNWGIEWQDHLPNAFLLLLLFSFSHFLLRRVVELFWTSRQMWRGGGEGRIVLFFGREQLFKWAISNSA